MCKALLTMYCSTRSLPAHPSTRSATKTWLPEDVDVFESEHHNLPKPAEHAFQSPVISRMTQSRIPATLAKLHSMIYSRWPEESGARGFRRHRAMRVGRAAAGQHSEAFQERLPHAPDFGQTGPSNKLPRFVWKGDDRHSFSGPGSRTQMVQKQSREAWE